MKQRLVEEATPVRSWRFRCILGFFLAVSATGTAPAEDVLNDVGQAQGALLGTGLTGGEAPGPVSENAVRAGKRPGSASAAENRRVQYALNALGFDAGAVDGILGARSQRAIAAYQRKMRKAPTGKLTADEKRLLIGKYSSRKAKAPVPPLGSGAVAAAVGVVAGAAPSLAPRSIQVNWTRGDIYASRLFAGPADYPPTDFAAYGILAFTTRASAHDLKRHRMICQAFVSSIRPFQSLQIPKTEQMVTVWPLASKELAERIGAMPDEDVCVHAVDGYGNLTADRALRHAAMAGADLNGIGPYLLAWAPPSKKGSSDAVVLSADLSDVDDYNTALNVMLGWVQDIERDPALWSSGWQLEPLRVKTRRWFDEKGTRILAIFLGK